MKRLLVFLVAAFPLFSSAQYSDNYFDVGLWGGISNYTGDLIPAPFKVKNMHLAAGIHGRYSFGKWVSVKACFSYGRISGSDANSKREDRVWRNLSFRSNIFELAVTGEWNLLGYHPRALERPFSPYLFVGVGAFYYSPMGRAATGEWVNLRNLGTEGQLAGGGYNGRTPYSSFSVAIPMGVGVKWAINSRWGLGVELGFRKTFTDYLDDVSLSYPDDAFFVNTYGAGSLNQAMSDRTSELPANQQPPVDYVRPNLRGDEKDFDWYLFMGLSVSYHFLDEGLAGSSKRLRRKPGCKGARF